jgi:hypothetical protein
VQLLASQKGLWPIQAYNFVNDEVDIKNNREIPGLTVPRKRAALILSQRVSVWAARASAGTHSEDPPSKIQCPMRFTGMRKNLSDITV